MNKKISRITNNVQDRTSIAWEKLCNYIERLADTKAEEFSPLEELGSELFSQIHTLPESISKLKHIKKIWLYGSSLKRIPPEIGELTALEYFDPYTSYDLHWFPYEITNCKNLKNSRVSTRILYGNYKNRMGFPDLNGNPVRYLGEKVRCSICRKEIEYADTNQLWVSLWVGTDILPLLVNSCSKECENMLPKGPENYVLHPHKGGSTLKQPIIDEWEYWEQNNENIDLEEIKPSPENEREIPKTNLIRLLRKIWDR